MQDVRAVPSSTWLGKNAAWDVFAELPSSDSPVEITSDWPWMRLLANMGKNTSNLVGDGIVRVFARKDESPRMIEVVFELEDRKTHIHDAHHDS